MTAGTADDKVFRTRGSLSCAVRRSESKVRDFLRAAHADKKAPLLPKEGGLWEKIFTTPSLWHFHFVESPVALDLVKGRERLMLEHVWKTNCGDITKFPEKDKVIYAKSYRRPGVMRDAFEYLRAFNRQDAEDNRRFSKTKLPMPLLIIGKATNP